MALHADIPSRGQIERLLQARGDRLVSIYLPTSPITPEADAARIVFKNLAARASEGLRGVGASAAEREAIEEALDDLHDDRGFWTVQAHYGVVDELCRRVILAGGTVVAVRAADVPGGGPAAAILRYPV